MAVQQQCRISALDPLPEESSNSSATSPASTAEAGSRNGDALPEPTTLPGAALHRSSSSFKRASFMGPPEELANRPARTIRAPLLGPCAVVLMGLLYGALITFIPTIKSSLPAPLTALLSSPVPDTPVTEPPAERTAAEPPSKRDRKLWKLNFSAMKRKLLGRSAKAPGADGGVLLYGYYQMNDQKWAALRQLKEEVDARPELRRHAREVQHELTELTLLRFLEVSYWRVEKDGDAGPRLVDVIARTVEWRDQMGAVAMAPAAVRAPAAAGKLYVRGADRQGRPVIHFRPAREHAPFDVAANTRLVVYTLERALRAMPPGQSRFAVVVDCAGFTLGNFPPVAYIKESLGVMMNHYPMRLGYVRIVNAGRGLNFFWKIIASMLQERTTKKISFLGGPATCDALLSELPPQALPDTICGTDTWTYDVDQYLF